MTDRSVVIYPDAALLRTKVFARKFVVLHNPKKFLERHERSREPYS